jgi:hypothetical protein
VRVLVPTLGPTHAIRLSRLAEEDMDDARA